jgi:hypothetical protein
MKKAIFILISTLLFGYTNSFRITYQNLKFSNEHLGLLETSYLFNFKYFYTGIGIYSAITGQRGGFFTGGINLGFKYPFNSFSLDSGIFIGGGGGGHAPQGSGLMLKIYAGANVKINKKFDFVANMNKIKFKDGAIDSNQIALGFDYKFKDLYFLSPPPKIGYFDVEKIYFNPFIIKYYPINSTTLQGKKQESFTVIGAEIGKIKDNFKYFLSAAGALKGNSDGYAEYLFGIAKDFKFFEIKASIGAAGGGNVDTKGGVVYKIALNKNISFLNFAAGYFGSFGGIKAYYIKAGLNKKFDFATIGNKLLKIKPAKFKFSLYSESYLPSNTIRKNGNSKRLDVLNIDLGYFISKNGYLFVNAASAYNGNSGGYAVGMFGIGYQRGIFFAKGAIGAAGGGSVDVGGGLIAKATIGLKYKNFSIGIGRIKAFNGRLNTTIFDIGIDFDFYKGIVYTSKKLP